MQLLLLMMNDDVDNFVDMFLVVKFVAESDCHLLHVGEKEQ